jgi:hypothetical protein
VTAAYNLGSTMARTLESLDPGTPVFAGSTRVGSVTGVYSEGDSRAAELIVVRLDASGSDVGVPGSEIQRVDEQGVHLMRQEPDQYADLAPFDPARFPTMKKLK